LDREADLRKSVLLIGVGRFGKHIASKLRELNHEVLAIDKCEERIESVMQFVDGAQIGDSTNEEFLRTLGVNNFDVCIVAIGKDFQSSLETASLLKELGGKLVVARASRDVQAKFLLRNGADEVIYPEKQVAKWTAIRYTADHILDYIQLDNNYSIFEVTIPPNWIGYQIGELDIRKKYNINILALKKDGVMDIAITPTIVLSEDKTMLVVGEYKALQKCFHI